MLVQTPRCGAPYTSTLACMADTPPSAPDEPLPEWWNRLSAEDRATVQRIMREKWRPTGKTEDDIAEMFAKTRIRIREIEQRALRKLRGNDGTDN